MVFPTEGGGRGSEPGTSDPQLSPELKASSSGASSPSSRSCRESGTSEISEPPASGQSAQRKGHDDGERVGGRGEVVGVATVTLTAAGVVATRAALRGSGAGMVPFLIIMQ